MTLTYDLAGDAIFAPVGPELIGQGAFASYRFWSRAGLALQPGANQTLRVLFDPRVWSNVVGQSDPGGFADMLPSNVA